MLTTEDFALTGSNGSYVGSVPPRWCFDGRSFGGFSASLALAAIALDTGRPVLASASIVFLAPCTAGPVEISVTTLRAGKSTAVAQALIRQAGRTALTASAVLADAWEEPTVAAVPPFGHLPFAKPDEATALDWLVDAWPMLGFAEGRGVEYPASFREFRDREPSASLWLRIVEDAGQSSTPSRVSSAWVPQLADVLHLDAHLFDAPGMITGFWDPDAPEAGGATMVSLDLNIAWQPGSADLPPGAWRLLEARGSVADRSVTSYGSLRAEDGSLIAMATSQGLLLERR